MVRGKAPGREGSPAGNASLVAQLRTLAEWEDDANATPVARCYRELRAEVDAGLVAGTHKAGGGCLAAVAG